MSVSDILFGKGLDTLGSARLLGQQAANQSGLSNQSMAQQTATHTLTTGDLTTANTPDWARGTTTVTPTPPFEWDAELNAYPHEHDMVQRAEGPKFCLICKRTVKQLVADELKRKSKSENVTLSFNSDGSFVAR